MKWYSVKKFKPPINSKVFAITESGDIWSADYRYDEDENTIFWSDTDCIELSSVTHFCIPDPIEIEE